MNARIRELYKQAHLVREYPTDDPMRGGNPPTVYWGGEASAKKFAELIVQECAGRVDWILAEGGGTQGDLIREHFGVKK
jgi:hypothetical protein